MDSDLRREIDGCEGNIQMLLRYSHGENGEAGAYAMQKMIRAYAAEGKFGALMEMHTRENLPEEIREKAGLAIVEGVPVQPKEVKGRAPPRHGILDDLAFNRKGPEKVRVAAGKKRVDIFIDRVKRGDPSGKAGINAILKHRRHHQDVKNYARNALDALEVAKEGAKGALKGKKAQQKGRQGMPKSPLFVP